MLKLAGQIILLFVLTPGWCQENVALKKPTLQSSTREHYGAELAVNGNTETKQSANSCSITKNAERCWWMVDLLDVYFINNIIFYLRIYKDVKPVEMYIEGFTHNPFLCNNSQPQLCGHHQDPSRNASMVNLTCAAEVKARFIKMRTFELLSLCEVEVYGVKIGGCMRGTIEKQPGLILSTEAVYYGNISHRIDCIYLCSRRPTCHVFSYNTNTSTCQIPEGLEIKTNSTADWDLYSFC